MSTDNANINILYRDVSVIVAVKPRGLLSELSPGSDRSFPALLMGALSVNEIFPVHRLDLDTEGIMVYALTKNAAASLSAAISNGQFQKEYDAWVHGSPAEPEGRFEDLLFRDTHASKVFVVKRERKGVKRGILSYELIETLPDPGSSDYSLISHVHICLETGRTHQIRVQFASRKMPVLGDKKYGARDNYPSLALSATSITFPHPDSGKMMNFNIPFDYKIMQAK